MAYEPKNFDRLYGTPGFSDELLKDHFTLYQGYVKNSNKLLEELHDLSKEGKIEAPLPQYSELKRRLGWELNGMRLHEYYFGNMTKKGGAPQEDSQLIRKLKTQFGSLDTWIKDFKETGMIRGIGWVILCLDPMQDRLLNLWIDEHDTGHLAGSIPLVVMDVFEHAFTLDYGLKRAEYIEAFFKAINWTEVSSRFESARVKVPVGEPTHPTA